MRTKNGWQRWMATAALVSALVAPAASASVSDGLGPSPALKAYQSEVASQDHGSAYSASDLRSPDARIAFTRGGQVPTSAVAQVSSPSGFQWGDAGIGAAGMIGLLSVCAGAFFLLGSRRRDDHIHRATVV